MLPDSRKKWIQVANIYSKLSQQDQERLQSRMTGCGLTCLKKNVAWHARTILQVYNFQRSKKQKHGALTKN
ncbi:hypothetical protein [Polynucleobacter necessarius]|uniref:hypothetical protein n=1 Tax=Polynucleobacter necessarius TaxID=576610 RepID=UPI0039E6851E